MSEKDLKTVVGLVKAEQLYIKAMYVAIGCVALAALACVLMYMKTEKRIKEVSSKVVLIDADGNVSAGKVSEVSESDLLIMQSKATVRSAIEYMYSFSSRNYDERMKMAKSFFGKSGSEIIQGYINSNVRQKVYSNSLIVDVVVQNIDLGFKDGAIVGTCLFEQSFINGDVVSKREMRASYVVLNDKVSSINGFGLIVDNWLIEVI